jgi:perosamine synthetase
MSDDDLEDDWLALSDPDIGTDEMEQVLLTLRSPRLSSGPVVERFEHEMAEWVGRRHGVAVASGTLGVCLLLKAWGIGPGDEVLTTGYAWHQVAHAIELVDATIMMVDIDY